MQPDSNCGAGAAKHTGKLGRVETFPPRQHEQLPVSLVEASERGQHGDPVGIDRLDMRKPAAKLHTDPVDQLIPATNPPMMIGQHPARSGIEPKDLVITRRHILETSPSDRECLGHDVSGVFRRTRPANRIGQHPGTDRVVHASKTLLALLPTVRRHAAPFPVAHTTYMSPTQAMFQALPSPETMPSSTAREPDRSSAIRKYRAAFDDL